MIPKTLWLDGASAHAVGRLAVALLLIAIVSVGAGVPAAAQTTPCAKQCRLLGLGCRLPWKVAFETQRAACTGEGRRLCLAAARIMYAAGRQLCRSVVTSCRWSCQRNGTPGDLACGDGVVAASEDCDPPGWASCTGGAACSADCLCPTTTD